MKLIVKCWTSKKNNKLVKGLFYETEKGRFLLTFDKWAIIALVGSYKAYNALKEGDEIEAVVNLKVDNNALISNESEDIPF